MFKNDWYIYSAILGFMLGVILIFTLFIAIKPNIISIKVYDRVEECKEAGGKYRLSNDGDWLYESCEIKKDLFK